MCYQGPHLALRDPLFSRVLHHAQSTFRPSERDALDSPAFFSFVEQDWLSGLTPAKAWRSASASKNVVSSKRGFVSGNTPG